MEDRLIENKAYRVILLGVIEIIGKNGLKSVLNYTGLDGYINNIPLNDNEKSGPRISHVTKLDMAIEDIFGIQGARAILFQVGRMQSKWGVDENPEIASSAKAAMSQMSEGDRVKVILNYTADTITKQLNTKTWIEQEGDVYYYKDEAATHCFNRKSETPVCYTTAGFVCGLVAWAVGNNGWNVEEIGCMATGQPHCTYRIYRGTAV